MREVSFGKLDIILKSGNRPRIEHLIFDKAGRAHKHKEYEYFYVFSGSGKAKRGEEVFDIKAGSLFIVPPNTDHSMWPNEGETLEAFLWYDVNDLEII